MSQELTPEDYKAKMEKLQAESYALANDAELNAVKAKRRALIIAHEQELSKLNKILKRFTKKREKMDEAIKNLTLDYEEQIFREMAEQKEMGIFRTPEELAEMFCVTPQRVRKILGMYNMIRAGEWDFTRTREFKENLPVNPEPPEGSGKSFEEVQ